VSQLTLNIYLDTPKVAPGIVHIWRKQGRPEHDPYKVPGSYGYKPEVVDGVPFATITPQPGMLMVINTRKFSSGNGFFRLPIGSFLSGGAVA
jgi:hypothetical protein